jgi:hypothetical protein
VEILLPVHDNEGQPFDYEAHARVRQELTKRFGGVTAFMRAPAQGSDDKNGKIQHDDIVIIEVMTQTLDKNWWTSYRHQLEQSFSQNEIVIRASAMTKL